MWLRSIDSTLFLFVYIFTKIKAKKKIQIFTDFRSSESAEASLIVQRDALSSSELLGDVVERAAFRLWEPEPCKREGDQSHRHKQEVDVGSTELLFE